MKWLCLSCLSVLVLSVAGCGVSPRVRVEPAGGSSSSTPPRSGSFASQSAARAPLRDVHVVAKGDTLYSIAFRNGLDVRDLIAWNRIAAPYTIFPGQALRLKTEALAPRVASLPQMLPKPPAATPTTSAVTPAPASGMTSMAQSEHAAVAGTQPVVDRSEPVRVEPLEAPATGTIPPRPATQVGSVVAPTAVAPGSLIAAIESPPKPVSTSGQNASPGYKPAPSAKPVATAPAAVVSPPPVPVANPVVTVTPAVASAVPVAAPTSSAPRIDASGPSQSREGISWRWPTSGSVIGRFVTGDPTQQGIDISGKLGQSVMAVADGEVVYSGNGLLGYGEMIIVQHSPDYLSAYGHNQRRLAAEGEKVKAGQVIAEMGQRGSQVILHFEVRRRGKPVDPLAYLPAR
jgi:lipoprotein NlpD